MKRILYNCLCLCLVGTLAACGSATSTDTSDSDQNERSGKADRITDQSSPDDNSESDTGNAQSCQGSNPAGCSSNSECSEGQVCKSTDTCIPSSCSCNDGSWICTSDCGGGECVADSNDGGNAACDAQDVSSTGPCEMILGVKWDGSSCTQISGCSCSGSDCGDLYDSIEDCENAHSQCNSQSDVCGGNTGQTCNSGEFCDKPEGTCGDSTVPGSCTEKPQFCTEQYDPVCGCDGNTYGNDCKAASAGVSIKQDGECGNGGNSSTCQSNTDCGTHEFCDFSETGSACSAPGKCVQYEDNQGNQLVCTTEYDPVCGCDGNTYSNECKAEVNQVSVASQGECESDSAGEGETCGGIQGITCDSGLFCNYPNGTCGANDQTGTCQTTPNFCTTQYDPVCGCDGKTYSNACEANTEGVSVESQGPCN